MAAIIRERLVHESVLLQGIEDVFLDVHHVKWDFRFLRRTVSVSEVNTLRLRWADEFNQSLPMKLMRFVCVKFLA